jgi:hypothetical protein
VRDAVIAVVAAVPVEVAAEVAAGVAVGTADFAGATGWWHRLILTWSRVLALAGRSVPHAQLLQRGQRGSVAQWEALGRLEVPPGTESRKSPVGVRAGLHSLVVTDGTCFVF